MSKLHLQAKDIVKMTLGQRMRFLRKHHHMTLAEIYDKTGLSSHTISHLERDISVPSIETLRLLADAYEMPLRDIFIGVDKYYNFNRPHRNLPRGFKELVEDPEYADELDEDWRQLLLNTHYRGCRCRTKRDWLELYLHLRRLFGQRW